MSQYNTAVTGNVPTNVAITFHTQAGDATPALNVINVVGAGGSTTSGGGNTVTVTSIANILPWNDINGATLAVVNNGYFATAALTLTLPVAPTQGQVVQVIADTGAGPVNVLASANQFIRIGNNITSGAAGTAQNNEQGDSLYLVFRASDKTWIALSSTGTWGLS
jgi:hypothetical protein